jgi:hypothetical protein
MERGCAALEDACSSAPLMVAQVAEKPDRLLQDRSKYFRARQSRSGWSFALTNGKSASIGRRNEYLDAGYVRASGQFYEPGQIVYGFNVSFSTETWSECERVFVSVGDAIEALSAQITPHRSAQTLRAFQSMAAHPAVRSAVLSNQQDDILQAAAGLEAALSAVHRRLPQFNDSPAVVREHAAQPKELGWINYWSPSTCVYLGFPDASRDQDLLAHSYQTPLGSWLMKLCPDPLDLARPDHLRILADAYERFPKVGIRAINAEMNAPLPLDYPQNTIFVRAKRLWSVVDSLVAFFRKEKFAVTERIPKGRNERVTIGVFPGTSGWVVIKTIPSEFWENKVVNIEELLFDHLCRDGDRECLVLNVYDDIEAQLIEVDKTGRRHVSGFREPGSATIEPFSGVSERSAVLGFYLLPMELDVLNIDNCGQFAEQVYAELGGPNADLCDNQRFATSIDGKVLQDRQGVRLRFLRSSR